MAHEALSSGPLQGVLVKALPDEVHKVRAVLMCRRQRAGLRHYLEQPSGERSVSLCQKPARSSMLQSWQQLRPGTIGHADRNFHAIAFLFIFGLTI